MQSRLVFHVLWQMPQAIHTYIRLHTIRRDVAEERYVVARVMKGERLGRDIRMHETMARMVSEQRRAKDSLWDGCHVSFAG